MARHHGPGPPRKKPPGHYSVRIDTPCWFPSSVAVGIISGEERKRSGLLGKQSTGRSAPAGSPAQLDLGVDHRQATNEIADRPCDLVHIPPRTNRLTGSCSPRPEAEILEVANGCYRKGSVTQISRNQG